ncbi:MAG: hypothetical protein APU95_06270 [Hadesarchaea archaeon YNP_N21]|nr:MAG: hypothetical protein APU95_06270 [Hadesarchaea archaeon YNP_N21]
MGVTVKFFANFREIVGKDQIEISGVGTVMSLLNELTKKYGPRLGDQLFDPKTRKLRGYVNILVNGRGVNLLSGLDTKLNDGDVVAIFPPVSGGLRKI